MGIERLLLRVRQAFGRRSALGLTRRGSRGRPGNVGDVLAGGTSNLSAADADLDLQTPAAVGAVEFEMIHTQGRASGCSRGYQKPVPNLYNGNNRDV